MKPRTLSRVLECYSGDGLGKMYDVSRQLRVLRRSIGAFVKLL